MIVHRTSDRKDSRGRERLRASLSCKVETSDLRKSICARARYQAPTRVHSACTRTCAAVQEATIVNAAGVHIALGLVRKVEA